MTDLRLVPATRELCEAVADRLRPEECVEVRAASDDSPLEAVLRGYLDSDLCRVALLGAEPLCIWGVRRENWYWRRVWLLGTDAVPKHRMTFLRASRRFLPRVLERFPHLRNWCDASYVKSLRWLKWLGFTIYPAEAYGSQGLPFCRLEIHLNGDENAWAE